MNILFFGKKRHGSGSHEYQRHIIRNMPINGVECYGRKMMMDNHTYIFDRFDGVGNAIFVDDVWDEDQIDEGVHWMPDTNAYLADTGVNS